MAVAATTLASSNSIVNFTSTFTSASYTTVSNSFVVFAVIQTTGGMATVNSITSTNGVTFSQIIVGDAPSYGRVALFGGYCTTGSSGTATITFSSANQDFSYAIVSFTGVPSSGNVVQSASNQSNTVTLATFAKNYNASFLAACNGFPPTIESGWTAVIATGNALIGYKLSSDNTPSFTGTVSNAVIAGIELAAADTAANLTVNKTFMMLGYGS